MKIEMKFLFFFIQKLNENLTCLQFLRKVHFFAPSTNESAIFIEFTLNVLSILRSSYNFSWNDLKTDEAQNQFDRKILTKPITSLQQFEHSNEIAIVLTQQRFRFHASWTSSLRILCK